MPSLDGFPMFRTGPVPRGMKVRIWLLRRIAGDRIVLLNARCIGGVHLDPHHPLGGEAIIVNCRSVEHEENVA